MRFAGERQSDRAMPQACNCVPGFDPSCPFPLLAMPAPCEYSGGLPPAAGRPCHTLAGLPFSRLNSPTP